MHTSTFIINFVKFFVNFICEMILKQLMLNILVIWLDQIDIPPKLSQLKAT